MYKFLYFAANVHTLIQTQATAEIGPFLSGYIRFDHEYSSLTRWTIDKIA